MPYMLLLLANRNSARKRAMIGARAKHTISKQTTTWTAACTATITPTRHTTTLFPPEHYTSHLRFAGVHKLYHILRSIPLIIPYTTPPPHNNTTSAPWPLLTVLGFCLLAVTVIALHHKSLVTTFSIFRALFHCYHTRVHYMPLPLTYTSNRYVGNRENKVFLMLCSIHNKNTSYHT